jgi:hypothetical protein
MAHVHGDFPSSSFLGNRRPEILPLALAAVLEIAGPCHLAALACLPLLLVWLAHSGARRYRRPGEQADGVARWALALLLVLSGLVLAITPFAVENEPGTLNFLRVGYLPVRFATCFLALTVVALAVSLDDFSRFLRARASRAAATASRCRAGLGPALVPFLVNIVPVLFTGAALLQQARILHREVDNAGLVQRLLVAVTLWVVGLGVYLLCVRWPRLRPAALAALGAALLTGSACAAGWLGTRWHSCFPYAYDQLKRTKVVSALATCEPGATRLCVLDYLYYPFFGSDRRFRVCQPFWIPSYPWLVKYVRAHRVTVVVVVKQDFYAHGRFRTAHALLDEHPEVFEPAGQFELLSVFRVRREQLEPGTGEAGTGSPAQAARP